MSLNLLFLVEEPSMKEFLQGILPKVLPVDIPYRIVPHAGKSDLQSSIPRKLAAWQDPETRFVIMQDQDSADCRQLKKHLQQLCTHHSDKVLIRIVCHELEAWYWGDLPAVDQAYGTKLSALSQKSRYREADKIENPKQELKRYIPFLQQKSGARDIAQHIDVQHNTSVSFRAFLSGLTRIIND